MRIERVVPATGMRQFPRRNRGGMFVLGNPHHGGEKHHGWAKVLVATEEEAIRLIATKGHSIRVWTGKALNMVRLNLFIDGRRVT